MQHNNSNDSRLEDLQPVDSHEAANTGLGSVHLLALEQKNDGESGFYGVVESDYKQITEG